jgi:phosphatidylglycerol:prolipoprotein diacylglycerol transferase
MWWHNFLPQATIFTIGQVSIRWYGFILVSSIILAAIYAGRTFIKRNLLNWSQFEDLIFYLIIFSLIGARVGHVLYSWPYYSHNFSDIIKIWQGGVSIQGAILAGVLTLFWWCKKHAYKFYILSDVLVVSLALGQALGRWGNYFNQELYGKPSDAWFTIPIAMENRFFPYYDFTHFQPVFFYESILNFLVFAILHVLRQLFVDKQGLVTWVYLGSYGFIRFIMEFIRIDDTMLIGTWRLPQVFSLALFLLALFWVYFKYIRALPKMKK